MLHRAAYQALDLPDWRYDAIECGVEDLGPRLIQAGSEWVGFSCTMPLKRVALSLASTVRPDAAEVGSANTLLRVPQGWAAENTDVVGVQVSLQERGIRPGRVVVLGAGGTAQAVVVALARLGVTACDLLVRDSTRVSEVSAVAARVGLALRVDTLHDAVRAGPLAGADLVVSTLPAGAADRLAHRPWRSDQALLDAVYDPWPTPLAVAMAAAGAQIASGALMLLHQAAAQVELMTGQPAPVEAMRAALQAAAPTSGV